MSKKPPANSTLVERIMFYVKHDEEDRAKALAQLGDYLENCFEYELDWDPEEAA